jgi:hypothetical protein
MRLRNPRTPPNPFSSREVYISRPPLKGVERRDDDFGMSADTSKVDLRQFVLKHKVSELEEELWHARRANITGFVALIGKIQEMSQRLFPGPVTMDYACDPEDPTNEYIVFDVVARGEFADYKDLFFQWHDEVAMLCPGTLSEFRLIVHPKV